MFNVQSDVNAQCIYTTKRCLKFRQECIEIRILLHIPLSVTGKKAKWCGLCGKQCSNIPSYIGIPMYPASPLGAYTG